MGGVGESVRLCDHCDRRGVDDDSCQADQSAVATVAKIKELKNCSWGQQRIVFRQFWKPSPVRAALLSAQLSLSLTSLSDSALACSTASFSALAVAIYTTPILQPLPQSPV